MDKLEEFRHQVNRAGANVAGFALLLMTVCVLATIVARRFRVPLLVTDEVISYGLLAISVLTLPLISQRKGQIRVDFVTRLLSMRRREWLELVSTVVFLLFIAVFLWTSVLLVWKSFQIGATANTAMRTPLFLPQSLLIIGFALLLLQCLADISHQIRVLLSRARPHAPGAQ